MSHTDCLDQISASFHVAIHCLHLYHTHGLCFCDRWTSEMPLHPPYEHHQLRCRPAGQLATLTTRLAKSSEVAQASLRKLQKTQATLGDCSEAFWGSFNWEIDALLVRDKLLQFPMECLGHKNMFVNLQYVTRSKFFICVL